MIEFATAQFDLGRMEGEGDLRAPRRVHLESLARQGDIEARWELDHQPECPPLGAYLWNYFGQLSSTRQSGGMGPARLTRAEIRQWEEDEGCPIARWERRVILAIDAAWFAAAVSSNDPSQKTEVPQ